MKPASIVFLFILFFTQILFSQTVCSGEEILKAKSCAGDEISEQETELFGLVNEYREQNKLAKVYMSETVCLVANRHALDLSYNIRKLTHSWSDCDYDPKNSKTFGCILYAPKRFYPNFSGLAFENVYFTSGKRVISYDALEAWKKSPMHNAVILNQSSFKNFEWLEGCVAIEKNYAALWFFAKGLNQKSPDLKNIEVKGLGVTFDQAVRGLNTILSIENVSSTVDSNKWAGISKDKSVELELFGQQENINEGKMTLRIRLQKNNTLSIANRVVIQTFLKNLTPGWDERNQWLEAALSNVKKTPEKPQAFDFKRINAKLKVESDGFLSLTIKPSEKPVPVEFK